MSFVTGAPRLLLRLEGAAVLAAVLVAWMLTDRSWLVFGGFLLAPDLAMIGYAAGPRVGAAAYNAAHTYTLPLVLGLGSAVAGWTPGLTAALVWTAHIGLDRALGYGLKYPDAFSSSHLGRVGRPDAR